MANILIKTDKKKEDIASISELIKRSRLKIADIIVPISVGIILLFLSIFVFIPMITSALNSQKEIKEVKGKIEKLKKLEEDILSIDENTLSDDVIIAKKVMPKILKVSDFIYYVDNLATEKNLTTREISAGDSNTGQSLSGSYGVSGPVSYTGSFENVLEFLDEVQNVSPYLIGTSNLELSRSTNDKWTVEINITGYYMPDKSSTDLNIYSDIKKYTTYQDIVDIFKEKAKQL